MIYSKYDASGNTFVIFHTNKKKDYSLQAIDLCKKEQVDGLIVVVPHMVYDFEWLFYNSDGSTASMCGNGTRAVAHYAFDNRIASSYMKFLTGAGVISCKVEDDIVETTMTKPVELKEPFNEEGYEWYFVDTGVPHLVTITEDLDKFDLEVCSKMRYKYNANVNFAKVDDGKLFVRTYERGVEDETLACGTGMTACFLRVNELGFVDNSVDVYPKSGERLTLRKEDAESPQGRGENIYFKGKVIKEFTKEI